jgi:hypothetical protein
MSRASKKIKDTQNQLIIARKEPTWPTNAMRNYQWHANCKKQRQPPTYAERNTCQKGLLQKERIFERQHLRIKLAKSWFFFLRDQLCTMQCIQYRNGTYCPATTNEAQRSLMVFET